MEILIIILQQLKKTLNWWKLTLYGKVLSKKLNKGYNKIHHCLCNIS